MVIKHGFDARGSGWKPGASFMHADSPYFSLSLDQGFDGLLSP
jgi:hypothetical protein